MPSFDYITAKEFRQSLESDYAEMRRCADSESWKSVQVLAGSIVEALLIDYLISNKNSSRPQKDPLKIDLAEAISICRDEKVLSDRTADLCSVVRSYRNLIHPGRLVRLQEQAPDKASASIALALIDMITEDLTKVLRATVGLTGEQLLSKIQRDVNSLTILKHMLTEVSERQQERLLLELIPAAHRTANNPEESYSDSTTSSRLELAYRMILEAANDNVRKRIAGEFVRILREEDGERVLEFSRAFFRPPDLNYVPTQHQPMVRDHLLGRVTVPHTTVSLTQIEGIGPYLEVSDVVKWLDPFVRTIISASVSSNVKKKTEEVLLVTVLDTSTDVDKAILKRFDDWIPHLEKHQDKETAGLIRKLKKEVEGQQTPF